MFTLAWAKDYHPILPLGPLRHTEVCTLPKARVDKQRLRSLNHSLSLPWAGSQGVCSHCTDGKPEEDQPGGVACAGGVAVGEAVISLRTALEQSQVQVSTPGPGPGCPFPL